MLNSAPVTPLANGQWEARVRDLPVSPSPMPEVGLADPSVRRAGPARSTAFAHLKTFIPAGRSRRNQHAFKSCFSVYIFRIFGRN